MIGVPTPHEAAERRRAGLELLRVGAKHASLHVLATFNIDLLPPFLAEAFAGMGLTVDVRGAAFGQLNREILDPQSALYSLKPAEVLLVPAPEDLLEPLFVLPPTALSPEDADALVEERLSELTTLVETLLRRLPTTTCYLVAFGTDRAPIGHVLDPLATTRRQKTLERFTAGVRALSTLSQRLVVVDWDWHIRTHGWTAVRDDRLWYVARMRLNSVGHAALADLVARSAAAYHGRTRKVLAVDFDGVLWGGIVGEVGLKGVQLGGDGIGLAFVDFQRELLKLQETGVLLVGCSRNNPADPADVFEHHSGMLLRRHHFAAERVNWDDKATSLRDLAAELNVGLDSFVFLDDNRVERTWVRTACPEVIVPELPDDPAERPAFIRAGSWFLRVDTTEADLRRAASYQQQRQRRDLQQSTASFDEFLLSLDQEAWIEPVHEGSLARVAQLCQRTNQFNLTTKRYSAADLEGMIADDTSELYTLAVRDRFGDSGITGFAIIHHQGEESRIDTFLMSCRILGRKFEDAFLGFLGERAASRGSRWLVGAFDATAKNTQVASFYPDRGFEPVEGGVFRIDLSEGSLRSPPAVRLMVASNA